MTTTNYAIKSNDIIFYEELKDKYNSFFEREKDIAYKYCDYCIFGIDFEKVISYKVVESVWEDESPSISVFIIMETGKKYILEKKTPNQEKVLNKITDSSKDQIVDLKYIFDLIVYD